MCIIAIWFNLSIWLHQDQHLLFYCVRHSKSMGSHWFTKPRCKKLKLKWNYWWWIELLSSFSSGHSVDSSSRGETVFPWCGMSILTGLTDKESRHKAPNQIGHTALRDTFWTTYAGSQPRWGFCYVFRWRAISLCSKFEIKLLHTHRYRRKGFVWAEVQLHSIATVGEALA